MYVWHEHLIEWYSCVSGLTADGEYMNYRWEVILRKDGAFYPEILTDSGFCSVTPGEMKSYAELVELYIYWKSFPPETRYSLSWQWIAVWLTEQIELRTSSLSGVKLENFPWTTVQAAASQFQLGLHFRESRQAFKRQDLQRCAAELEREEQNQSLVCQTVDVFFLIWLLFH